MAAQREEMGRIWKPWQPVAVLLILESPVTTIWPLSGEGLRNPHNCHRPHSKWQSDEFHFDHCQKITVTQSANSWEKIGGHQRDFKNQEQT